MIKVTGNIILPSNCPEVTAKKIVIEARDTSVADAPSKLISEQQIKNIKLKPGSKIKFQLDVPAEKSSRTYSIRVHIDINGNGRVENGDLLTTAIHPIMQPEVETMNIPVVVI
jgi:putative lipoprotein